MSSRPRGREREGKKEFFFRMCVWLRASVCLFCICVSGLAYFHPYFRNIKIFWLMTRPKYLHVSWINTADEVNTKMHITFTIRV